MFSVGDDDEGGADVRISVTVDESLAPEIANAVAQDRIYVGKGAAG